MENCEDANLSVLSSEALTTTLYNAIQALGRGFDVTSDVRLLYCKGAPGSRLVRIEEGQNRDLELSDGNLLPNVPADIECSPGITKIQRISVCSFHQMAKEFNERSGVKGNIPLGSFNAMFNYTGSWQVDAASTKSLALVGYFISLYEVKLAKFTLVLRNEIKRAVPSSWDPASLASFIENYGTHIVTSVTIGGRDVVYIRQHQSSPLPASEIENYVNDIMEHRFHEAESQSITGPLKYKDKVSTTSRAMAEISVVNERHFLLNYGLNEDIS